MECLVSKDELLKSLDVAKGVMSKSNTLPILSHALLRTNGKGLEFTATDLETMMRVNHSKAEIIGKGDIALPITKLHNIVKGVRSENVRIQTDGDTARITGGGDTFKLMGLASEDYPFLPEYKEDKAITISSELLSDMIKKTIFAVSSDETRHNLSGVFFEGVKNSILRLIATDGYRLSKVEKKIKGVSVIPKGGIILPSEGLNALVRAVKACGNGDLKFWIDNKKEGKRLTIFRTGDLTIAINGIDGTFPDHEHVMPKNQGRTAIINRKAFIDCLRRFRPFSDIVMLDLFKGKMGMEFQNGDPTEGSAETSIKVNYKKGRWVSKFNVNFLLDILNRIDEEEVEFEFFDKGIASERINAILIRPVEGNGQIGLLMPVKHEGSESYPEPKPETKPDPKTEKEPAAKPEDKSEVKTEAKPKVKPASKPDKDCPRVAMIEILGRKPVPTDEKILSEMNQRFPDKKFGGAILSWYKNRFQKGLLKGMDGKSHKINPF